MTLWFQPAVIKKKPKETSFCFILVLYSNNPTRLYIKRNWQSLIISFKEFLSHLFFSPVKFVGIELAGLRIKVSIGENIFIILDMKLLSKFHCSSFTNRDILWQRTVWISCINKNAVSVGITLIAGNYASTLLVIHVRLIRESQLSKE